MHSPLWMIVHDKMWHVNYSVTHFICRRVPSMPSVLVIDERPLSAIWNSAGLSQNLYKNNYKEITKNYCKSPSKELQYGYRKGKTLLDHEIFFFLFFGISGVRHPPPAVLLHSCRPTPHRRYSASCAKEPVWFRTGFFASKNPEKSAHSAGKYDLRSICLFFCKGHL